jgi:transposase
LYVGIDVGSRKNAVYLMLPDGGKHSSFAVQNDSRGATILSQRVSEALGETELANVVLGIEATSIYGDNLVRFLKEDGRLASYGRKVHVLNPKQVHKFKQSYSDLPKTDAIDAFVIADNLRFGRVAKEVPMDDYRYDALRTLTRARYYAVQNLTREKQRFLNYVFMKFSSLVPDEVFSNTFGTTSLAALMDFETPDVLAYMDLKDLAAFVKDKGRNHFDDPEATAKALKAAALSSYRLPKTVNDSVNQVMAVSLVGIRSLEQQIATLDKAIADQLVLFPNTLTSIKGIGNVYAAGIIAEVGDIHRFSNQAALAKYAGLTWNKHQSGTFEADETKLIRSGNRFLRYYLIEAANSLKRCDSEYRRYYRRKFKEVPKHQHKRALALTARKLVRLVYALLKSNRLYMPPEDFTPS